MEKIKLPVALSEAKQVDIARSEGVTPQAVSKWFATGVFPVERCARIERRHAISRRDLRPADWGDIWPELIDAEHPWPPVADEAQGAA